MAGLQDLIDPENQLGIPMQAAEQPFVDESSSEDEEPLVEPMFPPVPPGRAPTARATPQSPSLRMPPPVNASPFRRKSPTSTFSAGTWDPLPATPKSSTMSPQ